MKPLLYVAAPYSSNPVHHTHTAIKFGSRVFHDGLVTPIIPHLSLLADLVAPEEVEFWYDYDLEILSHCHMLVRLPGESYGANAELSAAIVAGMPVHIIRQASWEAGHREFTRWLEQMHQQGWSL